MKAAAYLRYSSQAQREVSLDDQLTAIEQYAKREGHEIVDVYKDAHLSGTNDKRPDFQRMIYESESAEWECVIVYSLSRFARSRLDSVLYRQKLLDSGKELLSATEPIPDSIESVLMISILEGVSEYQSLQIGQLAKRGMTSNAYKCLWNGVKTYGYRPNDEGLYEIYEDEARHVKELFEMASRSCSFSQLMDYVRNNGIRTTNGAKPTDSFVRNLIANPKYKGTYKWGDVVVEDGMPAIVDKDTWEEAQQRVRTRGISRSVDYFLVGKAYCTCGHHLTGEKAKKDYYYYRCTKCGRRIRKELLEVMAAIAVTDALTEERREQLTDMLMEFQEKNDFVSKRKQIKKEIDELDKEMERIVDCIVDGTGDPKKLRERLDEKQLRQDTLQDTYDNLAEFIMPRELIRDTLKFFAEFDTVKYRCELLVARIVLTDDDVRVAFTFDEVPSVEEINSATVTDGCTILSLAPQGTIKTTWWCYIFPKSGDYQNHLKKRVSQ